jgi:hypothetical protein
MLNEIINNSNSVFDVAEVSVGQHYYGKWWLFCHGQVLMTTWFVLL